MGSELEEHMDFMWVDEDGVFHEVKEPVELGSETELLEINKELKSVIEEIAKMLDLNGKITKKDIFRQIQIMRKN